MTSTTHGGPVTTQRLTVIINGGAGTAMKIDARQLLADAFTANGIEAEMAVAESGAEIVDLAQQAARGNARIIVAGGGDGTISAVAGTLAGTDKILGVLPLGTLNHFAKDLRIPLDLAAAVQVIGAGHAVNVDVAEVNGRIFINNSGLGLYPSIVHEREQQQQRGWSKWPAFLQATLAVLRRYPFLAVRLVAGERALIGKTPFVFIGNNEYEMEGFNLGGRACLNAGQLSLFITQPIGRMGLLRLGLRALFGRLRQAQDFIALCTDKIEIETRRKQARVALDGEVTTMATPLHYRVRPGALRVLVPPDDAMKEGPLQPEA